MRHSTDQSFSGHGSASSSIGISLLAHSRMTMKALDVNSREVMTLKLASV